jgi:hypothetical protein
VLPHGVHEYTRWLSLAHEYFDRLEAPVEGFYTFDDSAHSPNSEEPEYVRRRGIGGPDPP